MSEDGLTAPCSENVGFTLLSQPTNSYELLLRARHQEYSTDYARPDPLLPEASPI